VAPGTLGLHLTRGFLFADLRGYTAFVEAHGDEAAAGLLDAYRGVVRQVVQGSGGAEIKTEGDSFYVVFPSASQAVRCGLAIVAAAEALTAQEPGRPIAVGVGVHAGETAETAEGYVGLAVNVAARICAQASAGEVLVSDTVRSLVRSSTDVTFNSRGKRRLKGIVEPVAVYAASAPARPGAGAISSGSSTISWSIGAKRGLGPLGAGIAIVLVVAIISAVLVSGAFGGSNKTEPSPGASNQSGAAAILGSGTSPTATASVEPSVDSAAPSTSISPLGIPIEEITGRLALKAGTYTALILPGTPSMTVADGGWSVVGSSDGDMILARTTTPDDRVEIRWVNALSSDVCGLGPAVPVGADPEHQFDAWARAMTGLQVSPGIIRQFGPLTTQEHDIAVVPKNACQYSTPVAVVVTPYDVGVGLFQAGDADGTTNLSINAGVRLRLEVTSRNGKLVLIIIQFASPADFATFQPLVENLLSSLEFAP
jgi:class 3 adenylate cyclase